MPEIIGRLGSRGAGPVLAAVGHRLGCDIPLAIDNNVDSIFIESCEHIAVREAADLPPNPQVGDRFGCRVPQTAREGDPEVIGNRQDLAWLPLNVLGSEALMICITIPSVLAVSHTFCMTHPRLMMPRKSPSDAGARLRLS